MFRIVGAAGRIALKSDVWLETNSLDLSHKPEVECIRYLHLRTYVPLFRISATAGLPALNFNAWLETYYLCVLTK